MSLVDRQSIRAPVHLARPGVNYPDAGVVLAAGLEHRELRAAVDVEVRIWVAHAVDVADLAGEVEDNFPVLHQCVQRRLVAHVGDVDAHAVFQPRDVEPVSAIVGVKRIDDEDVSACIGQTPDEITADKAEPAGHHYPAIAIEGEKVASHAGIRTKGCGMGRSACYRPVIVMARARS